jgi:hypothetical protein
MGMGKPANDRAGAGRAHKSGICAGERILPACEPKHDPNANQGPCADDSYARALAAVAVRQVHDGPRFWVKQGP